MIQHFYHVWADGAWQEPLTEHVTAVLEAGLPGEVTVGIVGAPSARADVCCWLADNWPRVTVVEADSGFEQFTLRLVSRWAREHRVDGLVLYAHTKGAYMRSTLADLWRRSMTFDVVSGWRDCVAGLSDSDVAGSHWLTPQEHPSIRVSTPDAPGSSTPFFGGNFWWATARYLVRLPQPAEDSRWDAERWVGLRDPRVHNRRAGWPSASNFHGGRVRVIMAQHMSGGRGAHEEWPRPGKPLNCDAVEAQQLIEAGIAVPGDTHILPGPDSVRP